jgi:hypothetical protein
VWGANWVVCGISWLQINLLFYTSPLLSTTTNPSQILDFNLGDFTEITCSLFIQIRLERDTCVPRASPTSQKEESIKANPRYKMSFSINFGENPCFHPPTIDHSLMPHQNEENKECFEMRQPFFGRTKTRKQKTLASYLPTI